MQIKEYYISSFETIKNNVNMVILTFIGILLMIIIVKGIFVAFGMVALNLSLIDINNISFSELLISLISIFLFIAMFTYALIEAPIICMAGQDIHKQKIEMKKAIFNNIISGVKIFLIYVCMLFLFLIWIVLSTTIISMINIGELSAALNLIWILGIFSISIPFKVAPQSIVLGNKSVLGSIKESTKLFLKNKGKYVSISFINIGLILFIFEISGLIDPILLIIIPTILSILLIPYFAIILTQVYYDSKSKNLKTRP